jgi:hypothetical protein
MIRNGEVAKWNTPWKLADVQPLARPVPYVHKSGAVTWVTLDPDVQEAIAAQLEHRLNHVEQNAERPVTAGPSPARKPGAKEAMSISSNSTAEDTADARLIGQTTLTEGNIKHGHIYLRPFFDRFPADAVGGSSKASPAAQSLTVETSMGDRFETDLDGSKKFFRARGPIRGFFEATKARPGDEVHVERLAPYSYRISLQR